MSSFFQTTTQSLNSSVASRKLAINSEQLYAKRMMERRAAEQEILRQQQSNKKGKRNENQVLS